MIGTGVFTSLGFQLVTLQSAPQILLLWAVGGIVALCGALCYSAVAKAYPRSGGEHHFLSELFHPALGFMAGLLSAITGFAVPTALTALALSNYLHVAFPALPVTPTALAVILLGTLAHSISSTTSARVQLASTCLKLLLILGFIAAALSFPGKGDIRWTPDFSTDFTAIGTPAFAVSLYYVFYSYSGWNAAIYGLEEWDRPTRTVRLALIVGTLGVTLLYLALNASFLRAAPVEALQGRLEIGAISAQHLFGDRAGQVISALFAAGLFASVSALLWAGPRVLAAMADHLPTLGFLTLHGTAPRLPLWLQASLAAVLALLSSFRELVLYTQTGLTLCTLLVAAGVLRLPGPKPVVPAGIFLAFTSFVIVRSIVDQPWEVSAGLATALACAFLGLFLTRSPSHSSTSSS